MNHPRWWVLPRKSSTKMVKHSRKNCRSIEKADAEPMLRSGIKLNGTFTVCRFCSGEYEPSKAGDFSYYQRAKAGD
jgi:hypothetical protein